MHAPLYFGTRTRSDEAALEEDVRRLRTAAWEDQRTPSINRTWHGLMPGIRAHLRVWETPPWRRVASRIVSS